MIFERRCRAHRAMDVPHRSQMVGLARRRRPKLQARTRRSGGQGGWGSGIRGQALPIDICAALPEKNFALAGFFRCERPASSGWLFQNLYRWDSSRVCLCPRVDARLPCIENLSYC